MSEQEFFILQDQVRAASIGIRSTLDDMKSIHIDKIVGPSEQYGHDGLADSFREFGNRWQVGVSSLIQDSDHLADSLNYAIMTFAQVDHETAKKFGIPIIPG